jgi:hypothetical protein
MSAQLRILAMCRAIREVQRELRIGDFDRMTKLYFEFTDMVDMYSAEAAIMCALESIPSTPHAQRRLDRDAVEFDVAGVSIILRCMTRHRTPAGPDAGYTDVKFKTIIVPPAPPSRPR